MGVVLLRVGGSRACRVVGRVNRFVVRVELGGRVVEAHNTNTGRLVDVLVPGRRCLVHPIRGGRLGYRLWAVEYVGGLAVVDTLLQGRAFEEAVSRGLLPWARGCRVAGRHPAVPGAGRLDYVLDCGGSRVLVESKSAVLAGPGGEALYPDTVSLRGRRHVRWLIEAHSRGVGVALVFVAAFPGARCFAPNPEGDPVLARLIWEAVDAGVPVYSFSLAARPEGAVELVEASLPLCPRR